MDADEYYGQLIDKIENDIKLLYIDNMNDNPYKDLFKFFFGIKVIDELKFVDCGHKRFNEFYYNNIQLEIKGCNNIEDSFKNYCKTEIMDGDNKINCEVCNIKRTCHKRQIFKSLPNILVIALKRFEFDYDTMEKIKLNSYLKFPFELDMKDYLIEDNKETNTLYELTGITIHDGMADFGHYYDLIKAPDNCWYKFNDKTVTIFNEDDIPKEAFGDQYSESKIGKDEDIEEENNAYILIYTKKNFNNENIEIFENNFKTKLASPPYDKMSNINDENKNIINLNYPNRNVDSEQKILLQRIVNKVNEIKENLSLNSEEFPIITKLTKDKDLYYINSIPNNKRKKIDFLKFINKENLEQKSKTLKTIPINKIEKKDFNEEFKNTSKKINFFPLYNYNIIDYI